jgi:hypothetical protein
MFYIHIFYIFEKTVVSEPKTEKNSCKNMIYGRNFNFRLK